MVSRPEYSRAREIDVFLLYIMSSPKCHIPHLTELHQYRGVIAMIFHIGANPRP